MTALQSLKYLPIAVGEEAVRHTAVHPKHHAPSAGMLVRELHRLRRAGYRSWRDRPSDAKKPEKFIVHGDNFRFQIFPKNKKSPMAGLRKRNLAMRQSGDIGLFFMKKGKKEPDKRQALSG